MSRLVMYIGVCSRKICDLLLRIKGYVRSIIISATSNRLYLYFISIAACNPVVAEICPNYLVLLLQCQEIYVAALQDPHAALSLHLGLHATGKSFTPTTNYTHK